MLLRLSEKYEKIHVCQKQNEYMRNQSRYFFGVHGIKWPPIILEMFSRKLDTLVIQNTSFPYYLTNDDIDLLRQVILAYLTKLKSFSFQKLPVIGKNILFKASCTNYQNQLYYIANEHTVKSEHVLSLLCNELTLSVIFISAYAGFLEIKHSSKNHSDIFNY